MLKMFGGGRKTTHNLISDNEMHFDSASRQTSEVGGGEGGRKGWMVGRVRKGGGRRKRKKNRYLLRAGIKRHQRERAGVSAASDYLLI